MTSQTLVPAVSPTFQTPAASQPSTERCASELQHLQAETEALLQQLQALKQERLASQPETPAS